MPTYEITTSISAAPEAAWHVLADVVRWSEWAPTVTGVEALDAGELMVGGRFRVLQPRLRPAIWTVTSVEQPKSFTWESRSPGMTMIAQHILNAERDSAVKVTLRFTFRGPLGAIFGPLSRKLVEDYMTQEAASLKTRVEECARANEIKV